MLASMVICPTNAHVHAATLPLLPLCIHVHAAERMLCCRGSISKVRDRVTGASTEQGREGRGLHQRPPLTRSRS